MSHRKWNRGRIRLHELGQPIAPSIRFPVRHPIGSPCTKLKEGSKLISTKLLRRRNRLAHRQRDRLRTDGVGRCVVLRRLIAHFFHGCGGGGDPLPEFPPSPSGMHQPGWARATGAARRACPRNSTQSASAVPQFIHAVSQTS